MVRRKKILVSDYFWNLVEVYKKNQVSSRTYEKYELNYRHLCKRWPNMYMHEVTADEYQNLLNDFAKNHERATTTDFHRQVSWALRRAFNVDGLLDRDVTYDVKIPKGTISRRKKAKFMEIEDMKKFVKMCKRINSSNTHFFLIILKTGLRFAEILGITINDIDFEKKTISINKTLDYKHNGGRNTKKFIPTKNKYSIRTIAVDDTVLYLFKWNAIGADPDESIFGSIQGFQFNSTLNNKLKKFCEIIDVPVISVHSLRHEHATYLVSQGIDSRAVAERLGHADDSVTREVYIHRLESEKARDNKQIIEKVGALWG